MGTLADLPEIVGFFSYSRDDDEDFKGALSALRDRIQRELRGQLGRTRADFRLWQDTAAIAHGTLWEEELKSAVAQSVFFIPIVTPTGLRSRHCKFEFELFLKREGELGRADLVFPILYIRVPALEDEKVWRADPVLSIVRNRQYLDWQEMRFRDINSAEVGVKIERFCRNVFEALQAPYLTAEERRQKETADAARRADEERRREDEAAARRRTEDQRRQEAEARRIADEEQRREEARRSAERQRQEVEAKRSAGDEQRRKGEEARRKIEDELARRKAQGPWHAAQQSGVRSGQAGTHGGWAAAFTLVVLPWRPVETPQQARCLTLIGAASALVPTVIFLAIAIAASSSNDMAAKVVFSIWGSLYGLLALGTFLNSRVAAIGALVLSFFPFFILLLPIPAIAGVKGTIAMATFRRIGKVAEQ